MLLLDNIHLQMKISSAKDQPLATSTKPTTLPRAVRAVAPEPQPAAPTIAALVAPEAARPLRRPSVLFVGSPAGNAPLRQALPAEALRALGCETAVSADFTSQPERHFDVVVVRHPHAEPELVVGLVACAAFGARIILDVDMDYAHLPLHHPDKTRLGLGTPRKAKAYSTALRLAHLVCVPSQPLAQALRGAGHQVMVMPPGWSRSNSLWSKAPPARDTINVGWLGSPGQMEDVAEIRRPILRVLREFPQTRLVVGGDPKVYDLFKALPHERRRYLRPVSFDDYAGQLSQVDVLLVPLRATPFNQGVSDLRLVEAGIRGVPWIASPLPAYEAWGEGGLLARTPNEWYAGLRQLVTEADRRAALGQAGRQQAEEREMSRLGPAWLEMIEKVRRGPRGRSPGSRESM
jgi:glycosyltransferase involved in cell wall biosynthesis